MAGSAGAMVAPAMMVSAESSSNVSRISELGPSVVGETVGAGIVRDMPETLMQMCFKK
jgi:hypothetical protein